MARRSKIPDWISCRLSKKLSRCFAAPKTHHIGLHGVRLYCRGGGGEKKKKLRERLRCIFQPEYSINCQVLSGESVRVIPKAISPKDSQILRGKSPQKDHLCNSANSADTPTHSGAYPQIKFCLLWLFCFYVFFFAVRSSLPYEAITAQPSCQKSPRAAEKVARFVALCEEKSLEG